MYCCKSVHNHLWRRHAGEEEDVAALGEAVNKFDAETIHVGKRKHTHHAVAGLEESEVFYSELNV